MASDRFFGQALLESDFVNPNFFYLLAKEDKKALKSCHVHIPPTALFEQGFAKAVFTTEYIKNHPSSGEVKKKVGRDVDSEDVFEIMTKGADERGICAVLIFASGRGGNELTNVRFMEKEEVRHFIFHELEKPKCLMQRFVPPKGSNNSVILATWSPLMVLTEGRRSLSSLLDRHVSPNLRGLTFEDPTVPTLEFAISDSVVSDITKVCAHIAEHFERTERLRLNRITAFFKVDSTNQLTLLYTTSLRFFDQVMGQPPVSLATHVHVAELQKKSLTQRFQGLGSKVKRDTQDALDWMDEALGAADEKNAHMRISIPVTGNVSAMIFEESRSGSRARRRSPQQSNASPTRGTNSRASNAQRTSRSASIGSPTMDGAGNVFPIGSPKGGAKTAAAAAKIASSFTKRSNIAGSGGGGGGESAGSPVYQAQQQQQQQGSFEGQYLTLANNAPLPQPRQLIRYQHVLPNSTTNMSSQVQLHALGLNEEAIRSEWDGFLTQQLRDIKKIRIAQAAAAAHRSQGGGGTGAGIDGADGEGGPESMRDDAAALRAPPPPKRHAFFEPNNSDGGHGSNTSDVGGAQRCVVIGEEKDVAKLTAASMATLKAAQDKAAKREKDTFMEEMRDEIARRALKGSEDVLSSNGKHRSIAGGGDGGDAADDIDDDPRFHYIPRDGRQALSVPDGIGVSRSTLLPPVFHGGGYSGGGGAAKHGAAAHRRGVGGNAKAGVTSSVGRPLPSRNLPPPSSSHGPNHSNNASIQNVPASSSHSNKQHAQPPLGGSAAVGPNHSNKQQPPSSSPDGSPVGSPTSVGSPKLMGSNKGFGGNNIAVGASTTHAGHTKKGGAASGGHTPSRRGTTNDGSALSGANPAAKYRREASMRLEAQRNYVEESLAAHARVAKMFDDFGALGDPDEIAYVVGRAEALCERFSTFVQELHYSIHGAFLNKACTSVAYVEVPPMFQPIVDMKTMVRILHKLHPIVQPRAHFLLHHPSSFAAVAFALVGGGGPAPEDEALRWRTALLSALSSVSLTEFSFEQVDAWAGIAGPQPPSVATTTSTGGGRGVLRPNGSDNDDGVALEDDNDATQQSDRTVNTTAASSTIKRLPPADSTDLLPVRDLCLVVPLVDGDAGLKILRAESFSIVEDVKHYIDPKRGIVYCNALRHCYFERLTEIKGAQAALEERRQQEEEEGNASRAAAAANASSLMSARRQLHLNDDDDAAAVSPTVASNSSHYVTKAVTPFLSDGGGGGSPRARSKMASSLRVDDNDADPRGRTAVTATPPPATAEDIISRKVDEMMCLKCSACRICCVCSLVAASPKRGGGR